MDSFTESSIMAPYLLKIFKFVNDYLENKQYFVANRLTGVDFMMGFALNSLIYTLNQAENYPYIKCYVDGLTKLESWKKTVEIESSLSLQ